jgi:lauroyl/myristoyl acyltransferase
MRLQDFFSSPVVTQGGIRLAQVMPRWAGHGLARFAAALIARAQPELYHVVQANLRQILGPEVAPDVLAAKTQAVFAHAGQTYYDFFHAVDYDAAGIAREIEIPPDTLAIIRTELAQGHGCLLLGAHMSNFDLGILALGTHGLPIQALSLANPNEGFAVLNRLRAKWGLEITPITPQSLRQAIRRLKEGGLVMTAFDRPIPDDQHLIPFFGRPAYFALGPARLAVMTRAKVFMGCCHYVVGQGYVLHAQPIEMVYTSHKQSDIETNACRMAEVLEGYVRQHPEQWMMFHPFWPNGIED